MAQPVAFSPMAVRWRVNRAARLVSGVGLAAALLLAMGCSDSGARGASPTTAAPANAHDDQVVSREEVKPAPVGAEVQQDPSSPFDAKDLTPDKIAFPANAGLLYGWGAWQPAQMNRPLHGGVSKTPISAERRSILGHQLEQARAAALNVGTVAEAEQAGYVKVHGYLPGRGLEYVNFSLIDHTLDLSRPEVLAFPDDAPDTGIMAIAYYVLADKGDPPPDTFPTEVIPWHSHFDICHRGEEYILSQDAQRCAAEGGVVDKGLTGWMLDLWVVPGWENPWGLVSSKNPDLIPPKGTGS